MQQKITVLDGAPWNDSCQYEFMVRGKLRIKALREAKGLTQEQLADLVGVAAPTIQRIEAGERNKSFERIYKIAEALGCGPGELFEEYPNSSTPQDTGPSLNKDHFAGLIVKIIRANKEAGYDPEPKVLAELILMAYDDTINEPEAEHSGILKQIHRYHLREVKGER